MEIFLWVWFFESQFFFNIKSTLQFFKNACLLPIVVHFFLIITCLYYLYVGIKDYDCDLSYILWIAFKLIFSGIFVIFLMLFLFYVMRFEETEKEKFANSSKFFKQASSVNKVCDNWIKKKALISPLGQMIFFLGIINLCSALFLVGIKRYNKDDNCNEKLENLLLWHSVFIICSNSLVLLCAVVLLFTKVFPIIFNYLCPQFNSSIRKKRGSQKTNYASYIEDYQK